jgi:predicted Zn-dependent peptidase
MLGAILALGFSTIPEAAELTKTILPNGITILTKPSAANNIVSVVVTLKMGSLYETDAQAGLSTLMQDTIQKGTTTRSSEQIAIDLESLGTRLSASSGREIGNVSLISTSEKLYDSMKILYDILVNPSFPDDIVELQKDLQTRNILIRYDQPIYLAMDLMVDAHFGSHPFHKPALGYEETIESFNRDDILAMYSKIYVPNNMVITAVGNFDEKKFVGAIRSNLGSLPRGSEPVKVGGEIPDRTDIAQKIETRETAASWFALGWPSPRLTDSDYYAMEMLNCITGGSMDSRLFVAIREKRGLAYQVSSFTNPRMDAGIYVAYIGTKPESYEEAKQVLVDEVRLMGKEAATDEEIRNAKKYLEGMHIMGQESNEGQASLYGTYETLGVGSKFVDDYVPGIERVSADDIISAGRKYLMIPYALGAVLAK